MPTGDDAKDAAIGRVAVVNPRGLHARAAAKFVKLAEQFTAAIDVSHQDSTVTGTSIMGLLMLAASPGATIKISAVGSDADRAVAALVRLVADGFGEC